MGFLSALFAVVGCISGLISIYWFITSRPHTTTRRSSLIFGIIGVGILLLALIVANLPSASGSTGTNPIPTSGNSQPETGITPEQATPTPTPTQAVIQHKQLSQDMLLNYIGMIGFIDPPKDIVVNNKLLQADFGMNASSFPFKLDGQPKSLQLECGLADDQNYKGDTYRLKVLGDNQELLSQIYVAGQDAIANEINIQGVQILTLVLTGTYGNPGFYCKDQLIY
jgi:hypothetical protein